MVILGDRNGNTINIREEAASLFAQKRKSHTEKVVSTR